MGAQELSRRVRASLAYTGRTSAWLARQLGVSARTIDRRLSNKQPWLWPEVVRMKELFRWKSLDSWEGI